MLPAHLKLLDGMDGLLLLDGSKGGKGEGLYIVARCIISSNERERERV